MTNSDLGEGPGEADYERIAAEWIYRRRQGLSQAELIELRRWLEADSRHGEAFAELEETSHLLDQLRERAPVAAHQTSRIRRRRLRLAGFAALAAGAAAAVAVLKWHPLYLAAPIQISFQTGAAVVRRVDLPDGSVVQLNSNSAADIDFTAKLRLVRLTRGEAFFTVAKNPARPFYVKVGTVSVRAVGTAFNISYRADLVQVIVTEGRVRVEDRNGRSVLPGAKVELSIPSRGAMEPAGLGSAEALLTAGEKAEISVAPRDGRVPPLASVIAVAPAAVETALAWREQKLRFSSARLSDVVAEFNRYNRHKLVIADPALGQERFGGAFAPHDYDSFVAALEQGFDVKAERNGDATILHQGRDGK